MGVLAEVDPERELTAPVRRLIVASEQDPLNMPLARELRQTLLALPPGREPDPVERRQATVAARHAEDVARAARAGLGDRPLLRLAEEVIARSGQETQADMGTMRTTKVRPRS